jgi:hypothetical protein
VTVETFRICNWTLLKHPNLPPIWVHKTDDAKFKQYLEAAKRLDGVTDFPPRAEVGEEEELALPTGDCPECGKPFEPDGYCLQCDA